MIDVYIVPDYTGPEAGTKDQPFSVKTSTDLDNIMRSYAKQESIAFKWGVGAQSAAKFPTLGAREWNDSPEINNNPGFRLGRSSTIDMEPGVTLVWDVDNIPPEHIGPTPIWMVPSIQANHLNPNATPIETWGLLPRGQAVRGGAIDLQFDKALAKWNGQALRVGGVCLVGHEAEIDRVHVVNSGAHGYEGFPLVITGALGSIDRNKIATLDPASYILDAGVPDERCSHITNSLWDGYNPDLTNDQVSVMSIWGSVGEKTPGEWVQTQRAYCYQRSNKVVASGKNMVQGHTFYHTLRALATLNKTDGAAVLVYGDFWGSDGIEVIYNEAIGYDYAAIRFLLSPTGPAPEQFHQAGHKIGPNKLSGGGPNVDLNTFAAEYKGPPSALRYIRNIEVDAALTLDNQGGENVTRTNVPAASHGGCFR